MGHVPGQHRAFDERLRALLTVSHLHAGARSEITSDADEAADTPGVGPCRPDRDDRTWPPEGGSVPLTAPAPGTG